MMARTKAHQLLMGALLGICLLSTLLTARAGNAALEKPKSNVEDWSKSAAPKEVSEDIKKLLKEYDSEKGTLSKIAKNFDKSRDKNGGIRKLGVWGITLSRTYHLPGVDNKKGIYQRMMDNADNIAGTYKEGHSYIEDANMRGWPMLVGAKDKKPSHEAFNAGSLAMALCLAAKASADNGDDKKGGEYVSKAAAWMWDGFLTPDKEKTKLDSKGWVVYVPSFASKERAERHLEITEQEYCLDVPQAYNHGILVARAAIACDDAMEALSWGKAKWDVDGVDKGSFQSKMRSLIKDSGKLLLGDMKKTSSGGEYPGSSKPTFYQWNYRDVSDCSKDKKTYKDRFEDIAHAPYETSFLEEFYEWGGSISHKDIHYLVITFLNKIVADYKGKGGKRFACDVDGTKDSDSNKYPSWSGKQCNNARALSKRSTHAPKWLTLAYALRNKMGDKDIACDVYLMMKTVLPMMMEGSDFDDNFKGADSNWMSHAVQAKYYFYNFDAAFAKDCSNMDPF